MEFLLQLILDYRYWVLFPLACIEGPIIGFVAGVLVAADFFNPIVVFGVLIAGDVVPDITYYCIGRFGNKKGFLERLQKKLRIPDEQLTKVQELWHTRTTRTMFITKFAYGLSTPLLVTAGLVRLPFKKFILHTSSLSVLQYSVLMTLGYFLGSSYSLVEDGFLRIQIFTAGVAIFAGIFYFFGKSIRRFFWQN